jgi:predicted phosphatase
MNSIRQPAEPKPEFVQCAIVELLEIAQRQGITPDDFIQLLDSGMHLADFLAAMNPLANVKPSIDCDS